MTPLFCFFRGYLYPGVGEDTPFFWLKEGKEGEMNSMGYALVIGLCYICGQKLSFNPLKVPSMRDEQNERQPICQSCVEQANITRKEKGLPLLTYAPDAYTFCDENEL
jgi:hypothetical protein